MRWAHKTNRLQHRITHENPRRQTSDESASDENEGAKSPKSAATSKIEKDLKEKAKQLAENARQAAEKKRTGTLQRAAPTIITRATPAISSLTHCLNELPTNAAKNKVSEYLIKEARNALQELNAVEKTWQAMTSGKFPSSTEIPDAGNEVERVKKLVKDHADTSVTFSKMMELMASGPGGRP